MSFARVSGLLGIAVLTTLVAGCATLGGGEGPDSSAQSIRKRTQTPGYREISARYNARVAKLERVAAQADLAVTRPDEKGEMRSDQIEGYMQFRRPCSMNLRIDKVGSTLFVMGSNDERFWWFDVAEQNRGWYGTHAKARREVVERFGVPVQPADLAELLGIVPLDPAAPAKVSWTDDGARVRVVLPAARGVKRLELDPVTFEPARIELVDEFGDLAVAADLSRYVVVPVRGNTIAKPRAASLFEVEIPAQRTRMTIRLSGTENPAERQKDVNFDFEALVDRYGIDPLENLDEWVPRGAAAGEKKP